MYKRNGSIRGFLYVFFFACLLAVMPACGKLFPPKTLDVTIYPQTEGYCALIQVSGMKQPALLIESSNPDLSPFKGKPGILILGVLNSGLINQLQASGIMETAQEINFPGFDKVPDYVKKLKLPSRPMRQNGYVPLRNAEMIILAPFDKDVYDEKSYLTFKLIYGKKSFIFAPVLNDALIQTLTQSFGKNGLRTDFLVVSKSDGIPASDIEEIFVNPKTIIVSDGDPKSPLHFQEIF